MIISLGAEKAFGKMHYLHDKGLGEIRDAMNILEQKKGNIHKPTFIKLNEEKLPAIPL